MIFLSTKICPKVFSIIQKKRQIFVSNPDFFCPIFLIGLSLLFIKSISVRSAGFSFLSLHHKAFSPPLTIIFLKNIIILNTGILRCEPLSSLIAGKDGSFPGPLGGKGRSGKKKAVWLISLKKGVEFDNNRSLKWNPGGSQSSLKKSIFQNE